MPNSDQSKILDIAPCKEFCRDTLNICLQSCPNSYTTCQNSRVYYLQNSKQRD